MSIDALYPANGNNAIVFVVFMVEWLNPLEDEDFRNARSIQSILAHELPELQEARAMSVKINPSGSIKTEQTNLEIDGLHFLKTDQTRGGNTIRELQINRNNMVAIISDYDRWDSVWSSVSQWFDLAFKAIGKNRQFTSLALQYTDSFQWRDTRDTLNANEIFLPESPYLPPYVFKSDKFWHSHNGYTENLKDPVEYTLINNINVDLRTQNESLVFNINSSHKVAFTEPTLCSDNFKTIQSSLFQLLHQKNKDLLIELLTPAVCEKIGLKS